MMCFVNLHARMFSFLIFLIFLIFLSLLFSPALYAGLAKGKVYKGNPIKNKNALCLGEVDISFEQDSAGLFTYFQVSLQSETIIFNNAAVLGLLNAAVTGEPGTICASESVTGEDSKVCLYRTPNIGRFGGVRLWRSYFITKDDSPLERKGTAGSGGTRIVNLYQNGAKFIGLAFSHALQRGVGTLIVISLNNGELVIVIGEEYDPAESIRQYMDKHHKGGGRDKSASGGLLMENVMLQLL